MYTYLRNIGPLSLMLHYCRMPLPNLQSFVVIHQSNLSALLILAICDNLCSHCLSSLTLPPSVVLLDSSWKDVTSHPFSLILSITVLWFVCVLLITIARLAKYCPQLILPISHGVFFINWNMELSSHPKMHPKLIICILNVFHNKILSAREKRCTAVINHIHEIKLCLELM